MVSSQKRPYLRKRGADLSKRDESTDRIIVEDDYTDDFFLKMRTQIEEMTTTQIEYGHLTKRDANTHRITIRNENTGTTETSSKEI